MADRILDLYADGLSLRSISKLDGMPGLRTMFEWRADRESFRTALTRTREAKAESVAEDADLAVDEPLDLRMDGKLASAGVARNAQRAGHKRWLAEALDRATWGAPTAGVVVNVGTSIDLGAILPARPVQPDREVT